MKTINQRIELLIKHLGKNKNSFAKDIGVAAGVIQNILGARQSKPGFDLLNKISSSFEVRAEWLLNGKGSMFNEPKSEQKTTQPPEDAHKQLLQRFEEVVAENALLKAKLAECEESKKD